MADLQARRQPCFPLLAARVAEGTRHRRPCGPGTGPANATRDVGGGSAYGSGISGLSSSRARSNAGRGVSDRTCSSQNTPS